MTSGTAETSVGHPGRSRAWVPALVVVGWALILGAWQYVATQFQGALPEPLEVGEAMVDLVVSGVFFEHLGWSLIKIVLGFLGALLLGTVVGYLMGRRRYWRDFFEDGVTVAGTIPGLTYAILALVFFGISFEGPVLAVALISMPYIAINVSEGVQDTDTGLIQMSHAFGRTEGQIRRHVLFPSIVPYLFAGVRLAFAVAWKVEALTEVFGGTNGVGFQIRREYSRFSMEGVLSWMFLFIVLMLFVERFLLVRLERRLLAWRPERSAV